MDLNPRPPLLVGCDNLNTTWPESLDDPSFSSAYLTTVVHHEFNP